MYCVYCGTKLPDEARFCFICGKGVEPDCSAKDNTASTNECNDEEAADVNEAAGTESPDAFTNANDAGETANAESQSTLAAVNDAGETTNNEEFAGEKTTNTSEATDEELRSESAANEKGHNKPEAPGENDADGPKVAKGSPTPSQDDSPAPGISSDKTTVIPLAAPSDKTTILPGFGAEKAALEQEKSDEIAALAALYPDASPEQFCDPTPFEAKSPDITEFIAPMPISGTKPASAESIHYAESPKKKSAGKRALLIAIVVIIAALAAAAAFGMSLDISPNGR